MYVNPDRLLFSTTKLTNGHYLHVHTKDSAVTEIHVVTPLGTAHSHPMHKDSDLGWVHFLEHICFDSSQKHPTTDTYNQILQQTGAYQNAATYDHCTDFYMSAPTQTFETVLEDFLDHITYPTFKQSDIDKQKSIIKNERTLRKYYPYDTEISQYVHSKWMDTELCTREQVFGTDQSLEAITPTALEQLHQYYFSNPVHIYVGGSCNIEHVTNILESLPTVNPEFTKLPLNIQTPIWRQREFHEFRSKETDTSILYFGSFLTTWTIQELWAISFIIELLADSDTGTLQKWIRHEKGWSYGIETTLEFNQNYLSWQLQIPINEVGISDEIRKEFYKHIQTVIMDENIVTLAKHQQELQSCFSFETLSNRMEYAVLIQDALNEIPTEHDYINWIRSVTTESLVAIYEKCFSEAVTGEVLISPAQD